VTGDPSATPSRLLRGEEVLSDGLVCELLAGRSIAVLATVEADGAVHAVPLWFALHERRIVFATGSASRKVRNLERDPRATVVVHDSRAGLDVCGASIRGRVELVRGDAAGALVDLVHARYVSEAGLALPAAREFLSGDDVGLVLWPESAFTWDERGNPAAAALRAQAAALPLVPTTTA
jgi:PPOX class probable F420-dependent enzyme